MLLQIKAQQFYTDLCLQKIVEFKDFSRLLSDFPVLFKADLIVNDFSRKPFKFKYFSSMCEPCNFMFIMTLQPNKTQCWLIGTCALVVNYGIYLIQACSSLREKVIQAST